MTRNILKAATAAGVSLLTLVVTSGVALADHGSAYATRASHALRAAGPGASDWVAAGAIALLVALAYMGGRMLAKIEGRPQAVPDAVLTDRTSAAA